MRNYKSIHKCNTGDFIQAAYRDDDDSTPPPYHYIGQKDPIHLVINVFCLTKFVWNRINYSIQVCDLVPDLPEEMKLSVVPYLQDEPPMTSYSEMEEYLRNDVKGVEILSKTLPPNLIPCNFTSFPNDGNIA